MIQWIRIDLLMFTLFVLVLADPLGLSFEFPEDHLLQEFSRRAGPSVLLQKYGAVFLLTGAGRCNILTRQVQLCVTTIVAPKAGEIVL